MGHDRSLSLKSNRVKTLPDNPVWDSIKQPIKAVQTVKATTDAEKEVLFNQNITSLLQSENIITEGEPYTATKFFTSTDIQEDIVIMPGCSALIPTGLKMEIPEGFEIQVRPRSGLALKHQMTVLNTPGTIDADYRGDVGVILINHGSEAFRVTRGMRIAQLVLAPALRASFVCKEHELTVTARGEGGFGHTGSH